jgi:hypothetical protein
MSTVSHARHRFPPAIIQHGVWLYFCLLAGSCFEVHRGSRGVPIYTWRRTAVFSQILYINRRALPCFYMSGNIALPDMTAEARSDGRPAANSVNSTAKRNASSKPNLVCPHKVARIKSYAWSAVSCYHP